MCMSAPLLKWMWPHYTTRAGERQARFSLNQAIELRERANMASITRARGRDQVNPGCGQGCLLGHEPWDGLTAEFLRCSQDDVPLVAERLRHPLDSRQL